MKGKNMTNNEIRKEAPLRKPVSDLGMAAFVKMHGFKCAGRKGRNFYFEVNASDLDKFEQLCLEYVNSPYHDFDACIMAMKKVSEYLPEL